MRIILLLLLAVVVAETFKTYSKYKVPKSGSLLKRGGWKGLKVAGETSIGIASLTAALAILSSIEGNTDPGDKEMLERIAKERERLIALNSTNWTAPLAWGGSASGIVVLVTFIIVFRCIRRNNRTRKDSREEIKLVSVSASREKEPSGLQPTGLQFGDVGEFQIKTANI